MKNIQRMTAAAAAAALLLTSAGPALATDKGNGHGRSAAQYRVSERFEDMGEYSWGLSDVTKLEVKGIFKGRDSKSFAPGAKISRQEAAVATLRLIGKEADSQALTVAEVDSLLKNMPDQDKIASWARAAVAELVKLGFVSPDKAFAPTKDATRLDVAVLLVKALGHETEAQAAMNETLPFKDASAIPADLTGYVYVAVELHMIAGYNEDEAVTFRPNQPVKRVEMAVMMGRADGIVDRHRQDEVRGTVKAVSATNNSLTITKVDGQDATLTLSDDASIFVDGQEKSLADLVAGMTVSVKLNSQGKVVYVEAKTAPVQGTAVNGTVSAVVAPSTTALGLITLGDKVYPVAANATVTLNGNNAVFADVKVGDTVALTVNAGLVTKVAITRAETTVSGTISALTAPSATAAGSIAINNTNYAVPASVTVLVGSNQATFADLKVGDNVTLTLVSNQVTKVVVAPQQNTVSGTITALTAPTGTALGMIQVGTAAYPVSATAAITVNGAAANWADLKAGDTVALALTNGIATQVTATRTVTAINGTIAALTAPTTTALGSIQVGSTSYQVPSAAAITLNGVTVGFDLLKVGDTVALTLTTGQVTKVEATRAATVINGAIIGLVPAVAANGTTPATPAKIQISYMNNNTVTMATYNVDALTQITLNGAAVQFGNLNLGDSAKITLWGDLLAKVEVTR